MEFQARQICRQHAAWRSGPCLPTGRTTLPHLGLPSRESRSVLHLVLERFNFRHAQKPIFIRVGLAKDPLQHKRSTLQGGLPGTGTSATGSRPISGGLDSPALATLRPLTSLPTASCRRNGSTPPGSVLRPKGPVSRLESSRLSAKRTDFFPRQFAVIVLIGPVEQLLSQHRRPSLRSACLGGSPVTSAKPIAERSGPASATSLHPGAALRLATPAPPLPVTPSATRASSLHAIRTGSGRTLPHRPPPGPVAAEIRRCTRTAALAPTSAATSAPALASASATTPSRRYGERLAGEKECDSDDDNCCSMPCLHFQLLSMKRIRDCDSGLFKAPFDRTVRTAAPKVTPNSRIPPKTAQAASGALLGL